MTVSNIQPYEYSALSGLSSTSVGSSISDITSSDFMQLLLAQLRNQNPLQPMDDTDFMGMVTQLNSLQELQSIHYALQALVQSSLLIEASSFIGKTVEVFDATGETTTGTVTGVTVVNDQVMLWLDDEAVPLASVISIMEPEADEPSEGSEETDETSEQETESEEVSQDSSDGENT